MGQGPAAILWPMVGMAVLTALVWVRLYRDRVAEVRTRRIHPQQLATARQGSELLQDVQSWDNLRNLFEMPVLFYALCLALAVTGLGSTAFVAGAWAYVALRAGHTLVHFTYNRVMDSFLVYMASTAMLFGLWTLFAWRRRPERAQYLSW